MLSHRSPGIATKGLNLSVALLPAPGLRQVQIRWGCGVLHTAQVRMQTRAVAPRKEGHDQGEGKAKGDDPMPRHLFRSLAGGGEGGRGPPTKPLFLEFY